MRSLMLVIPIMFLLALTVHIYSADTTTNESGVQTNYMSTADFSRGEYQECEGLLLTIKLNEDSLRDKGTVQLDIKYKNMIEAPINLIVSFAANPYQTQVTDSQGIILVPKKFRHQFFSVAKCTLKPYAERIESVTLSNLYDLSKPGEYSVRLARSVNRLDDTGHAWVYTNQITFKLTQEQIDMYAKSKKTSK